MFYVKLIDLPGAKSNSYYPRVRVWVYLGDRDEESIISLSTIYG